MRLSLSFRKRVCRAMLGVITFAQLSVTAYACPVSPAPSWPAVASLSVRTPCEETGMPVEPIAAESEKVAAAEHSLDADAGALCLEHCRFGQQSNGSWPSPAVQAPLLIALYSVPAPLRVAMLGEREIRAEPPMATAAPPPHAIVHCCFRI